MNKQSGDTIVEVMLAIALLSAVLFTSWSIVNRSAQINLIARQRIEMVDRLKEQAEVIQMLRDQNPTGFSNPIIQAVNSTDFEAISEDPCNDAAMSTSPAPALGTHFYYRLNSANAFERPAGFKEDPVFGSTARTWVQYVNHGNYLDFYIRGCWQTAGGQQKTDNSQFILRLNI